MTEVLIKAEKMWESTQRKVLSEPLSDCMDRKGWKYNSCPFRDRCLFVYDWAEAAR